MNNQPLSASLAASFAIHPLFLLSGALKATSSISFSGISFRITPFPFSSQSNSDPPNHQRLGAVHLFVTPSSLTICEPDPCLAERPSFHSSNARIESVSLPLLQAVCLQSTKLSRLSSRKQQHQTRDLH